MDSINSIPQLHQQQFCLRWHNHQTSLLSTLPLLLDQSHLTDVTLSAEGKTLRAHRVVLSACSTFFSELFHNLEANCYPVIVIPGASFTALVALLTFMYSGEVNVFEDQIPALLALAETLGIKGLADFQNNNNVEQHLSDVNASAAAKLYFSSPSKKSLPLENILMKSFQFCPNILNQPLNFSLSALNKTTEFLNKCQDFCSLQPLKDSDEIINNENSQKKIKSSNERKLRNNFKKIDKIAENLRMSSCLNSVASQQSNAIQSSSSLYLDQSQFPQQCIRMKKINKIKEGIEPVNQCKEQKLMPLFSSQDILSFDSLATVDKSSKNLQQKPNNPKLYATCFICHKQLSNQYNLRVHLETHQNIRYACNVCSHVSRSKDALRKHVSYRHPGAPSLCENEAKRKRCKALSIYNSSFNLTKSEATLRNSIVKSSDLSKNRPFIYFQDHFNITSSPLIPTEAKETINAISSEKTQISGSSPIVNESTLNGTSSDTVLNIMN